MEQKVALAILLIVSIVLGLIGGVTSSFLAAKPGQQGEQGPQEKQALQDRQEQLDRKDPKDHKVFLEQTETTL